MNSPRPQRGQGRSDLFSKENLRFSPPPTPSPSKISPPPPPHPCRLDPKSCPAGLEIFGVRRRPAPWVHFCQKCADNCLPDVSETRQPACWPGLSAQPTQPQAQACLKQAYPASPAQRPARPRRISRPAPRSGLSNVSDRPTTSLTCLKLVSSYASHQAHLTFLSPSVRLPKQPLTSCSHPRLETSFRPSPSARLLACLTCLRLASGPAQPTRHPLRPKCV